MSTEPSTGITPTDLHAYFDGELLPDQAATVAEAIEADPGLRTEYQQLQGLRSTVDASFEAAAAAVPSARFEQIWDEIDRAIERDARLQSEAERNASLWMRLMGALRPVRVPLFAAAAAAAVTVFIVGPGSGDANKADAGSSVAEAPTVAEPSIEPEPGPAPNDSKIANNHSPAPKAPVELEPEPKLAPMPVPDVNSAEIHSIEFGGRSGRISNTGTVTVLYVEEGEASTNSERSL